MITIDNELVRNIFYLKVLQQIFIFSHIFFYKACHRDFKMPKIWRQLFSYRGKLNLSVKAGAKHTCTGPYLQAGCHTKVFLSLSGSGYMPKQNHLWSWSKNRIQQKHSQHFSIVVSPHFWRIQKETGAGTSRYECRSCQLNMQVGLQRGTKAWGH